MVKASITTGARAAAASRQGPSPNVTCSCSAMVTSAALAPSGTRSASSIRLMPAPSTGSTEAATAASTEGGEPHPLVRAANASSTSSMNCCAAFMDSSSSVAPEQRGRAFCAPVVLRYPRRADPNLRRIEW